MTKGKGNKLQTPLSAQNSKKKRPLNLHSDPPPKKKKFEDSDNADSDLEDFDFDKVIKKKLLSDRKVTPKLNQNKKRNRDNEDDSDADFLEINTDDSDLDEFDVEDDSELEPSDAEDQPREGKRKKLSIEDNKNSSNKMPKAVKMLQSNISSVNETELQKDLESKAMRDKRTLILRNVKDDTTVDDINSLTKEITAVRMISCKGKNSKGKKCSFIEFSDEAGAERNKKYLTGKKLNGVELIVDFVGDKSSKGDNKSSRYVVDPKILHVSGLKPTVTEQELIKLFPGCVKIDLAVSRKDLSRKDFVFVRYSDEAKCLEGHKQGQNMMIDGQKLIVQFAKATTRVQRIREKKHRRVERRKLLMSSDVKDKKSKKIVKPKSDSQEKKIRGIKLDVTKSPKNENQSKKPNADKVKDKGDHVVKRENKKVAQKGELAATSPVKKGGITAATKNTNPGLTTLRPPNGGVKIAKSSKKKNKKPKNKNSAEEKSGDFIKL